MPGPSVTLAVFVMYKLCTLATFASEEQTVQFNLNTDQAPLIYQLPLPRKISETGNLKLHGLHV